MFFLNPIPGFNIVEAHHEGIGVLPKPRRRHLILAARARRADGGGDKTLWSDRIRIGILKIESVVLGFNGYSDPMIAAPKPRSRPPSHPKGLVWPPGPRIPPLLPPRDCLRERRLSERVYHPSPTASPPTAPPSPPPSGLVSRNRDCPRSWEPPFPSTQRDTCPFEHPTGWSYDPRGTPGRRAGAKIQHGCLGC